jgi:hypothetical protein
VSCNCMCATDCSLQRAGPIACGDCLLKERRARLMVGRELGGGDANAVRASVYDGI